MRYLLVSIISFCILFTHTVNAEIITNEKYSFSLTTPNSDWKIVNRKISGTNPIIFLMNRNLFAFATVDIDEGLNIRDKSDLEKYLTETVSLVRKDIHRINGKFNLFDVKVLEKDGKLIGLLDFRTTISNEDMRRKIIFYLKKLCPRGTRIYRLETAAFWDYYDIAEEQFRQIRDSFTVQ